MKSRFLVFVAVMLLTLPMVTLAPLMAQDEADLRIGILPVLNTLPLIARGGCWPIHGGGHQRGAGAIPE